MKIAAMLSTLLVLASQCLIQTDAFSARCWLASGCARGGGFASTLSRMHGPSRANNFVSMSSVSPSPQRKRDPPKPVAFIMSPSTQSGEAEMMIIQNFNQIGQGEKKKIGIIGTQDLAEGHKQMIELLAYALVLSGNHVFTSGGGNGTNFAVIKGALRACNPDLLTVLLPQSLYRQPAEMQPLLLRVANLVESPQYDELELKDAANICNEKILESVDRILVFAYHSSETILKIVGGMGSEKDITAFYLD